ncbi:MFS transporter [Lentilactobacillus buchneri subsp. silagei]|uniref:MFS transporter n=1 Tax=Lentilactobacillus buchneri TaxID=1581 RepID=UPI0021A3A5FE|nr:MFS transporter [Lentilactobacillus buchneri]MCT3558472.1 MFS transporter [Lentilactobacillus buchneri]MCT3563417.1 MFS transporter [Lentilactobacillus buchneri]
MAQKEALMNSMGKIKHAKKRQISHAFSYTYLVGAVIILILSPIALLTDRKQFKS